MKPSKQIEPLGATDKSPESKLSHREALGLSHRQALGLSVTQTGSGSICHTDIFVQNPNLTSQSSICKILMQRDIIRAIDNLKTMFWEELS